MEVFGAGTACVVCPVGSLLYKGKTYQIPTMENGPDLAKRFHKELTDIQHGRKPSDLGTTRRLNATFCMPVVSTASPIIPDKVPAPSSFPSSQPTNALLLIYQPEETDASVGLPGNFHRCPFLCGLA
ncbi:branched-chain-amino-acid aminotransferase, cytosolic-like isoform X1 [Lates japonicus]|uniref:branched-chain-amino-acid transaminase n=1 Tax=Lates japonicus TaxID=270547 RepID=A0AAD3NJK5_LATJO|nr:branched-chain-amino-acid aminotransferase, cytosolic-like isoform X1 [Lates japonicus]